MRIFRAGSVFDGPSVPPEDSGRWKEPTAHPDRLPQTAADSAVRFRGLRLPLVGQLSDTLEVDHDDRGTRVVASRRLTRPAALANAASSTRNERSTGGSHPDRGLYVYSAPDRADTVTVIGPVLPDTVHSLRDVLAIETRGGTRSLTVDLNGSPTSAASGSALFKRHARPRSNVIRPSLSPPRRTPSRRTSST
jgi:hypothetical protein